MRLFVNNNEVEPLKEALKLFIQFNTSPEDEQRCSKLLERIERCDTLQTSQRRTRKVCRK